ncbi:inner membrane protein [Escherichia coli]|uniref:Inner membrane protein n=2 Tax=Enterobacteriaceae TaxID=543 RepID=A0A377BM71_ECOLX|nr:inner membrane protein [Escherichia coli]
MFDVTLLILLGLAALGFISHNNTVAVSILVLIIVRVTPLSTFFPWIEKQGLSIGIIILTIGVMAPIASGTLPPSTLIHSFLNWKSLVAIAVGVIVSWLGGARRDVNGQPAATGRRAAGRHCFRRGAVSRRTGRPAYCRGSGFADCGETVVNPQYIGLAFAPGLS